MYEKALDTLLDYTLRPSYAMSESQMIKIVELLLVECIKKKMDLSVDLLSRTKIFIFIL